MKRKSNRLFQFPSAEPIVARAFRRSCTVDGRQVAALNQARRQLALSDLSRAVREQDAKHYLRAKGRAMPRMTISIAGLVELLQQIAEPIPHCAQADLAPILGRLDADGCNWDLPSWPADDERLADCRALIASDIDGLRARYNVG